MPRQQKKRFDVIVAAPQSVPTVNINIEPLALSLDDAARMCGLSRWTVSEAIAKGDLKAKWAGRNRIVGVADLQQWFNGLEDVTPAISAERRAA